MCVKKAFNKVWTKDLVYKTNLLGFNPALYRPVEAFLKEKEENWEIHIRQNSYAYHNALKFYTIYTDTILEYFDRYKIWENSAKWELLIFSSKSVNPSDNISMSNYLLERKNNNQIPE